MPRLLLVAFLAVFSAGSVVQAGGAVSMTIEMALTHQADAGMAVSEACDDEAADDMLACDQHCASGAHPALLAFAGTGMEPVISQFVAWPADVRVTGREPPPPGHPPRHIL